MSGPVLSAVNITQSGSTPIASFTQTWTIGGTPTTVNVQALSINDPTSATAATVDANGLHVYPTIGAPNSSGPLSATNIAPNNSATLSSAVPVTSGKTGTLQHGIFSSTQPTSWTVNAINNSGAVSASFTFLTNAYETYDFRAEMSNEFSSVLSSSSNCIFQVVATNQGTNGLTPATVNANFFWAEN